MDHELVEALNPAQLPRQTKVLSLWLPLRRKPTVQASGVRQCMLTLEAPLHDLPIEYSLFTHWIHDLPIEYGQWLDFTKQPTTHGSVMGHGRQKTSPSQKCFGMEKSWQHNLVLICFGSRNPRNLPLPRWIYRVVYHGQPASIHGHGTMLHPHKKECGDPASGPWKSYICISRKWRPNMGW